MLRRSIRVSSLTGGYGGGQLGGYQRSLGGPGATINFGKEVGPPVYRGPPQPPMSPMEPVTPQDFNPHVDWFEFPKEIFDPRYPFTREECIRSKDEYFFSDPDELAQKYGVRITLPPTAVYYIAYMFWVAYVSWELWSLYRAMGGHPSYYHWEHIIMSGPHCPSVTEDEVYLDTWIAPFLRQRDFKFDAFWQWKPVVKEGAKNPWAVPVKRRDPSEWRHLTSAY